VITGSIVLFIYLVFQLYVSAFEFAYKKEISVNGISSAGMDASISVKPKQTDVFARLKNIIVMNVDSLSIHKKVITKLISVLECDFWGPDATIHLFFV
jgi:hypothetical protein